jgi:hypothetical protein
MYLCTPLPWRWRQHVRRTHCHLPTALYGVIPVQTGTNRVVSGNTATVSPKSICNMPLAVCCTHFPSNSPLTTLGSDKYLNVLLQITSFSQQAHQSIFPQPYTRCFSNEFISLHRLSEWVEKYTFLRTEMNTQRISATLLILTMHLNQNVYVPKVIWKRSGRCSPSRNWVRRFVDKGVHEIQTLRPWNLIGRNMTATSPVLEARGILPTPSSNRSFISARKNSARI